MHFKQFLIKHDATLHTKLFHIQIASQRPLVDAACSKGVSCSVARIVCPPQQQQTFGAHHTSSSSSSAFSSNFCCITYRNVLQWPRSVLRETSRLKRASKKNRSLPLAGWAENSSPCSTCNNSAEHVQTEKKEQDRPHQMQFLIYVFCP